MGLLGWLRQLRERRALAREARGALAALFERPDLRRMSSLRPEHRARAVLLGYDLEGGRIERVRFGLVRHPQPVAVRGIHHEVIEIYSYDPRAGTVDVIASHNVTKRGTPGAEAPPAPPPDPG